MKNRVLLLILLIVILSVFIMVSLSSASQLSSIIDKGLKTPGNVSVSEEILPGVGQQILQITPENRSSLQIPEVNKSGNETGIAVKSVFTNKPQKKSIKEADKQTAIKNSEFKKKGYKKNFQEVKKMASKTQKSKAKTSKLPATGKAIVDFLSPYFDEVSAFTGRVIRADGYNNLELPAEPLSPGSVEDVAKPKTGFMKIFKIFTGYAIIGVPDWAYDGSKKGNFEWEAKLSKSAELNHFEISLGANMSEKDANGKAAVNGIVYETGYYLDERKSKWVNFSFDGTHVGNTGWLREEGTSSITLENVTGKDYNVFLGYVCLKFMQDEWKCNDGKWVVFVVETGNVSYNQIIGEVPAMEFKEIKDLNVSDIPSILKQLNLSAFDFQPILYDAQLVSPKTEFATNLNQVEEFQFYVRNIGNRNITNLTFELDLGERSIADVVSSSLPSSVGIGKTEKGSISLLFKEKGKFGFPLFLKAQEEEVDTSDNIVRFSVQVGEPVTIKLPQDSASIPWNRVIKYTTKEPYTYTKSGSSLYTISGTDKMRTIFGGYYGGKSINPTLKTSLKPIVREEALFSTPFVASIFIGGEMLTGDRETVNYYVIIKNEKTGKTHTTPLLESMYKYYFNPKQLIPDFEFCVDYTSKVVLSGRTNETIDTIDPMPFNLCNFTQVLPKFSARRLQKLDGDYILITGGFDPKYYEDVSVSCRVEFRDPQNQKNYTTPVINSKDGFTMFKVSDVIPRYINYYQGEKFEGKVVLINNTVARGNKTVNTANDKINFVWKNWKIVQSLDVSLLLKDEKIKIRGEGHVYATAYPYWGTPSPWETQINNGYQFDYPSYMDREVIEKNARETILEYSIRDLNENKEFYNLTIDCGIGKQVYRVGDIKVMCSTQMRISDLNELAPLPAFKHGHYYDISLKVVSSNADMFVMPKPVRILYLDGLQFAANNPLLRTRFIFLENQPLSFSAGVSEDNIPNIYFYYYPKNTFVDSTGTAKKQDTTEREIKIQDLPFMAMPYYYNLDYLADKESQPSVALELKIVPLKNAETISASKKSFNCKIGRYEGICSRGNGGYNMIYIDEVNKFLYNINLHDYSHIFLKRYRDNPKYYDTIIYDILSEIDRNPIVNLDVSYVVEPFKEAGLAGGFSQYEPFSLSFGNNPDTHCPDVKKVYNYWWNFAYYYQGYANYEKYDKHNASVNVLVFDKTDSKIAASFSKTCEGFYYTLGSCIIPNNFSSLDLIPYHDYEIRVSNAKNSPDFVWVTIPFTYKQDYFDYLLSDENKNYLKKIPEINSTVWGPFDYSPGYNCSFGDENNYIPEDFVGYPYHAQKLSNKYYNSNNPFYKFSAIFVVNPKKAGSFYPGEETSLEELKDNTLGDRRLKLDSNRFYEINIWKYYNIYDYYSNAPINYNAYDSGQQIVCSSDRSERWFSYYGNNRSLLTLRCKWANIDKLEVYEIRISQIFLNLKPGDLYNLPDSTLIDFKNDYAEIVLKKYLEWHQPTPILNSTFSSY
jgi:hypothetical protein